MSKLDEFTLNVLCNPEIIEVDQDPLGESGTVIRQSDNRILMVKSLEDGSEAVGMFNRGNTPEKIQADWKELNITGKKSVRDLWHQKDLGNYNGIFSAEVPAHGVVMVKLYLPEPIL